MITLTLFCFTTRELSLLSIGLKASPITGLRTLEIYKICIFFFLFPDWFIFSVSYGLCTPDLVSNNTTCKTMSDGSLCYVLRNIVTMFTVNFFSLSSKQFHSCPFKYEIHRNFPSSGSSPFLHLSLLHRFPTSTVDSRSLPSPFFILSDNTNLHSKRGRRVNVGTEGRTMQHYRHGVEGVILQYTHLFGGLSDVSSTNTVPIMAD